MEEKFLNKIQKIIEELNKLDKMPNVVEWMTKEQLAKILIKKKKYMKIVKKAKFYKY